MATLKVPEAVGDFKNGDRLLIDATVETAIGETIDLAIAAQNIPLVVGGHSIALQVNAVNQTLPPPGPGGDPTPVPLPPLPHGNGHDKPTPEQIEAVLPAGTVETVRDGLASDSAIYSNSQVPNAGTDVIVRHNIDIDGEMHFRSLYNLGRFIEHEGAWWNAHNGSFVTFGHYEYNKIACRHSFHVANDRLFEGNNGIHPFPHFPDFKPNTDPGYYGMMGSANILRGKVRDMPWTSTVPSGAFTLVAKLAKEILPYPHDASPLGCYTQVAVANGKATLAEIPSGWKVGDEIYIQDTQFRQTQTTITGIDGNEITIADTAFVAVAVYYSDDAGNKHLTRRGTPKVANLTCSAVWDCPLVKVGDEHHRAHVVFLHGSHVHVDDSAFMDFGPVGRLGRYEGPHFHHGEAAHGDTCNRNVVRPTAGKGSTRGVVVHGYKGLLVEENVVIGSNGDGIFLEDGTEEGNIIRRNFCAGAYGIAGKGDTLPKGRLGNERHFVGAPVGGASHGIWAWAGNPVEDNFQGNCEGAVAVFQKSFAGDFTIPTCERNTSFACRITGPWGSADALIDDSTVINSIHGVFADASGKGSRAQNALQHITNSQFVLIAEAIAPYPPYPEFLVEDTVVRCNEEVATEDFKFAFLRCDIGSLLLNTSPRQFRFDIVHKDCHVNLYKQTWNRYDRPRQEVSRLVFDDCTGAVATVGVRGTIVSQPVLPLVTLDDKPYYALLYSANKLVDGPVIAEDEFKPTVITTPLPRAGDFRLSGKLPKVTVDGAEKTVNEWSIVRKGDTTEPVFDGTGNPVFPASRWGMDGYDHENYYGYPPGEYTLRLKHSTGGDMIVKDVLIESDKLTMISFP
jgi:hypothetical protein